MDVKASTAVDTACPPAAVELPVPVVPAGVGLPDDEGLGLPIEYLQKLYRLKGKTVLVTGGCGFVGRHIVFQLLCAGAKVRVFEVPQALANPKAAKYPQVEYVSGDVTNKLDLLHALVAPDTRARIKSGDNLNAPELAGAADVDTVIHVASPPPTINKPELFKAVNIGGTQNVMDCAIAVGCTRMVYTSSASVVADGLDQKNYDETRPEPVQKLDGYTISKLRGEQVVLRYGKEKRLATCALRPHAIFGPRDPHFWTALAEVGKAGKSKWMIGDGTNLVDHTYVENVAYSHTLAAAKLVDVDQRINGEAYFITNREPHLFWDFLRWVQTGYGWPQPRLILPYSLMWTIAWICGALKLPTTFNMQRVSYAGTYHYYSSEKAVRDFGYEPPFNLQQAVHKTLAYLRKFSPALFNPNPPKPAPKPTDAAANANAKPASGVKAFVQGWGAFVAMIAAIIGLVYFAVSNACCQWCGVNVAEVGAFGLLWRAVKTLVPALVAWKAINLTPFVPLGLQTVWFSKQNGQPASLKGKNVVITGGNKGIGFETAIGLAALGANVAIACRDAGRAAAAVSDIKKAAAKRMGDGVAADAVPVEALSLDLSSFASVNKLVDVLARRSSDAGRQVDVLICNAGGMCDKTLTADGNDMTFQSNYLSHFLLIDRLLRRGAFAADARIVSVSSLTHWQVNLTAADMEHISAPKSAAAQAAPFNAFFAYCRSKLAQVLHTRVLHAVLRSQKSNIAVLAVHPGTSSTDFVNHFHIPGARAFCSVFTQSAQQCAQTILYAACSREMQNVSGQYIANSAIGMSSAHSKDMDVARDLYQRSLALIKDV